MESGFPGKRFGGRWQNADTREAIGNSGGWLSGSQDHRSNSIAKAQEPPRPCRGESNASTKLVREEQPSTEGTENKEKPEWQVQREEAMARLDREAELNRQRESRLKPTKVFKPSVFVGRSED